jgi:hypothetical protein
MRFKIPSSHVTPVDVVMRKGAGVVGVTVRGRAVGAARRCLSLE